MTSDTLHVDALEAFTFSAIYGASPEVVRKHAEGSFKLRPYQQAAIDALRKQDTVPVLYSVPPQVVISDVPTRASKSSTLLIDIEARTFAQHLDKLFEGEYDSSAMLRHGVPSKGSTSRFVGKHPALSLPYGLSDLPPRHPMVYYHVQNALANWQ